MRILLANSSAYPEIGGVENSLRYIGRELLRAGHEVKVFCFKTSATHPLFTRHEGIDIIRCPYIPSRWPHKRMRQQVELVQKEILAVLGDFQPDAVWSRSTPVGLGIALSGYQGDLLQIFCTTARMDSRGLYLHSTGLPWARRLMLLGLYSFHYQMSRRIERRLFSRCQPVVFSQNMHTQLGVSEAWVVAPGVDADVFSPQNGARFFNLIEKTYGLKRDIPYVLYVGRLSTAKNLPLLFDAMTCLHPSIKLVLVGCGPEEDRLRGYAFKRNLDSRVIFVGSQSEWLPGFYALAKVCVLPSTIESFGQVYLESLASGTPVVGIAGDGRRIQTATDEIVKDGITGAVVRDVDPVALAEKIQSILSLTVTEYDAMSKRAREDACKRFSWSRFVQDILRLSVRSAVPVER